MVNYATSLLPYAGQQWRRRSDGLLVEVVGISAQGVDSECTVHWDSVTTGFIDPGFWGAMTLEQWWVHYQRV